MRIDTRFFDFCNAETQRHRTVDGCSSFFGSHAVRPHGVLDGKYSGASLMIVAGPRPFVECGRIDERA